MRQSDDNSGGFDVKAIDVSAKLPAAYSLLFTPDSNRLIVGSLDSSVIVFDLSKQQVRSPQSSRRRSARAARLQRPLQLPALGVGVNMRIYQQNRDIGYDTTRCRELCF